MVRACSFVAVLIAILFAVSLSGCGEAGAPGARHAEAKTEMPAAATAPQPIGEARYTDEKLEKLKIDSGAETAAAYGGNMARTTATPVPPSAPAPAASLPLPATPPGEGQGPGQGGDKFALIEEGPFLSVKDSPLSTFSIDVDTASYSKARQYLMEHHTLPPADAIRIEELVNYFEYDYAGPTDEHPFAVHVETAECPWQPKHRLVRFGIQGKKLGGERPVSNLVFLIDVSGSMNQPNKLPLVQRALGLLVRQLGENDRVAIVVYAGAAGLVLPPTSGEQQPAILAAIEKLRAGGSTNGGAGIHLAYQLAQDNFIKGGVNRVILCSDGDFNVGTTSPGELVRLATEKAKLGVTLSVLGFGIGNHNDAMLEQLSDKANGNYAFIDNDREAHKVFVEQMQGTLVTIAKDVKIQVEFNPAEVAAYRLIGYENRRLADRDFNDDTKDAGDIGAGHSVTALYQVVPVGVAAELGQPGVDPLKYQGTGARGQESEGKPALTDAAKSGELLTLKLRYQPPAGGTSTLITFPVKDGGQRFGSASQDFQFAAAVASFGQLLRNSKYKGDVTFAAVLETAAATKGADKQGLRGEFLELVKAAQQISGEKLGVAPAEGASGIAWHIPQRETPVVVVQPMPVQASAPVAVFSGQRIFALGLAAGALVSFGTLALCFFLVRLRPAPITFGPPAAAKAK